MGLDINSVHFLIAAQKKGVNFSEVLTIGRQDLNVFPAKMQKTLQAAGLPSDAFAPGAPDTPFAEPVFKSLGAKRVYSMDMSKFEGADFIHDLNQPIPADLRERFDIVLDGGTLEHVFNFPVALKNCMEMVKVSGRLILHTSANNYCGHGFYQFSPELFYSALSPENGFEMERMVVHMVGPYGRWHEVANPQAIRGRVEVLTFYPLQMLVMARRTQAVPIFSTPPQQSDYTPRWQETGTSDEVALTHPPARPKLAKLLPGVARLFHVIKMGFTLYKRESLWNRKCFRPVRKQ